MMEDIGRGDYVTPKKDYYFFTIGKPYEVFKNCKDGFIFLFDDNDELDYYHRRSFRKIIPTKKYIIPEIKRLQKKILKLIELRE